MRKEKNAKTINKSFLYQLSKAPQESSSGTFAVAQTDERKKNNAEKAVGKVSLKQLKESAMRLRFRLGGGRGII